MKANDIANGTKYIVDSGFIRGQKILHGIVPNYISFKNLTAINYQYNKFILNYWKWRV